MPDELADDLVETEVCCWLDRLLDDPEVGSAPDEPLDGPGDCVLADGPPDCALLEVGVVIGGLPAGAGEVGDVPGN